MAKQRKDKPQKAKREHATVDAPRPKKLTTKEVMAAESSPPPPYLGAGVAIPPEPIDDDFVENDGLTMRQRLFVAAITGPALGNATKAAEMAGYRAENRVALATTASENLRKPQIQRAIAHSMAKRYESKEWAKANLYDLASGSMANFITIDNGKMRIDWEKANAAGALGQIREVDIDHETGAVTKVKLYDKQKANDTLLKFHGLLKDGGLEINSNAGAITVHVHRMGDHDGAEK